MTAKKKEEGTKTDAPLLTEAEAGKYQRYMNSHRLTGNAMSPKDWIEMTKAAEKRARGGRNRRG